MTSSSTDARGRRLSGALGAVGGQVVLAAGSFLLQLLAARSLGADGFGLFALLFGSTVILTAVSSGLIGDSLTVLDRHEPAIRSALAWIALMTVVAAGCAAFVGASVGGLGMLTAALFAASTVAFMAADLTRRMLMACQRYWRLVLVDSLSLVASLLVLGLSSRGDLSLAHFLAALCVGQTVACAVAWSSLPAHERRTPVPARGNPRAVVAFGCWRAAQQFVRPTALNLTRWLVLVVAGQAAVGQLEAARLFVAPAMLLVQGVGAYLFSSYASDRDAPLTGLLRRADRGAGVLLAGALVIAGLATLAVPVLSPLLTDGDYEVAATAVLGWGLYAASCAVVLPYGSLAAVRGKQAQVLIIRVGDSLVGLAAVGIALGWANAAPSAAPWLLSLGSVAAGALVRQRLLAPGCASTAADVAAPAVPSRQDVSA